HHADRRGRDTNEPPRRRLLPGTAAAADTTARYGMRALRPSGMVLVLVPAAASLVLLSTGPDAGAPTGGWPGRVDHRAPPPRPPARPVRSRVSRLRDLEAGHVVLRHGLRIVRVLRLGAGVLAICHAAGERRARAVCRVPAAWRARLLLTALVGLT